MAMAECQPYSLGRVEVGLLRGNNPQSAPTVLFAHGGMEVSGGLVLRMRLQGAPVHKQTVSQASKHAHEKDSLGASNAAEVVMIGDIQPLMGAVFNSPVNSVEVEPFLGIEALGLGTGDQADALRPRGSAGSALEIVIKGFAACGRVQRRGLARSALDQ